MARRPVAKKDGVAKRRRFTKGQLRRALVASGGVQAEAARKLGVSFGMVSDVINNRWPDLKEILYDAQVELADLCFSKLVVAARAGEPWAVRTGLKYVGHRIGFTPRQEVTGPHGAPMQMATVHVNITPESAKLLSSDVRQRLLDGDPKVIDAVGQQVRALTAVYSESEVGRKRTPAGGH